MSRWVKTDLTNLGHLERELMEHFWILPEASVGAIHEQIHGRLAYTTVMTTLDRLYKKGILHRRKQGRAFLYSAGFSREQFKQGLVKRMLDRLLAEHEEEAAPLMAYLVETFQQYDARLLDELERLIQRSRERNKPKREE